MGAQVIELGVINETIHKVNECVRVADIDRLHALYRRTWNYCSPLEPMPFRHMVMIRY